MLGVLPNVPGFLKSAGFITGEKNFFDAIYVYAWFIGFGLSAALYVGLMKVMPKRA